MFEIDGALTSTLFLDALSMECTREQGFSLTVAISAKLYGSRNSADERSRLVSIQRDIRTICLGEWNSTRAITSHYCPRRKRSTSDYLRLATTLSSCLAVAEEAHEKRA